MSSRVEIAPTVPVIDRAELAEPLRDAAPEDLRRLASPNLGAAEMSANGAGEFVCRECGNRCTRGPTGVEYGHERGRGTPGSHKRCSRRPVHVDPGDPRGPPALQDE